MKTSFLILSLTLLLASCSSASKNYPPATDHRIDSVTEQDFFFYSCVRQYMEINSIDVFDGSVTYAVEYSNVSSKNLSRIYESAKSFAQTIRKPDYQDKEHGLPAVLVLCQRESRKKNIHNG